MRTSTSLAFPRLAVHQRQMPFGTDAARIDDGLEIAEFGVEAAFGAALDEALGLRGDSGSDRPPKIIFRPCRAQNSVSCGTRAMVPSRS